MAFVDKSVRAGKTVWSLVNTCHSERFRDEVSLKGVIQMSCLQFLQLQLHYGEQWWIHNWYKDNYPSTDGVPISILSESMKHAGGYTTESDDTWPARRQTLGYLPSRRALPAAPRTVLICYRAKDELTSPGSWWHTKIVATVYRWTVTHPSTNRARRRVTSLMINRHLAEVRWKVMHAFNSEYYQHSVSQM